MAKATVPTESSLWQQLTVAQQRVVLCIRNEGPLTRELLGQRLGWPASSVSREVSPLLAQKVLFSDPPGARPPNQPGERKGDGSFSVHVNGKGTVPFSFTPMAVDWG